MSFSGEEQTEATPLVVLIDDYEDTRYLFSTVLLGSGFRVAQAESGEQGVALAFELSPDIVVTDLSLPDIDGCEVTRRLKANERTKAIPVVVFSAFGSHKKVREALEAGCATFISKMSSPRLLPNELRLILDNQPR